jgi:hypothetical protein
MNLYLAWAGSLLYYLSRPLAALAYLIFYLLTPVWYLLYVILLPFGYVGHYVAAIVTYPLRFLATLEVRQSSFTHHGTSTSQSLFSCGHSQFLPQCSHLPSCSL